MTASELKKARVALGLSQAQLAEELGLSRYFVGLMERGDRRIEKRTDLSVRFLLLKAIDGARSPESGD